MVKCKVTEVIPLSKTNENPVIVHFQNGCLQPNSGDVDLECLLARDGSNKLMAIAAQADNVYTGRVGEGFAGDLMRNFIGIRNKVTNKIRLIEVDQCSMLGKHYQPDVAGPTARTTDAEQAYKIMLKTYGGKAANRMLEKKEKMRLNVDVVKEQLDKTMNDTLQDTVNVVGAKDAFDVAQAEREQTLKSMVPKLNEAAKRLEDVYRLTDLIDESLLKHMDSDALAVLRTAREDLPIKAPYLLDIIKQCQNSPTPDSTANLNRIKVCIYVDALLNFLKGLRNTRQNMKETNFSDIAERVETDIRKNFRQPDTQKIAKTNYIQHKAICYVVILSLMVSDKFELDTVHLVEALNTSKTQLVSLATMVAVRRKPKSDLLTLKLPSQLRPVRKAFERSSRRSL